MQFQTFFGFKVNVPLAPVLSAAAAAGEVDLSWTASSGATSYSIYRGTSSGSEVLLASGVAGTSYPDTAVIPGTAYFYKVTATGIGGESVRSNEVTATPLAALFVLGGLNMSMRALLLAARDHLREALVGGPDFDPGHCEITDEDGKPPASVGEYFVGVHEVGDWITEDVEGLSEIYGIGVTISVRYPKVPQDRFWKLLLGTTDPDDIAAKKSLLGLVETVRVTMHLDVGADVIINKANTYISGFADGTVNGFVEPLRLKSMGRSTRQPPKWFGSNDAKLEIAGYSRTIIYAGAKRVQTIESMT